MSQQITLSINQAAIESALIAYVKDMGIDLSNANTSVSLTAGRGANGYTADITIEKQTTNAKAVIPSEPIKRTSGETTKKLEPVEIHDKEDDTLEISEEEESTTGPTKSIFG